MERVRSMTEAEADIVAQLERELFSDSWSRAALLETYAQKHAEIFVVEEEEILGYAIVYYVMDEGEIARIAVSPKWRRRGVGRRLLDKACEVGRERGAGRLLLDVRESNDGARCFYENYGFCMDGIRRDYYRNPTEHAILMSLPIEG